MHFAELCLYLYVDLPCLIQEGGCTWKNGCPVQLEHRNREIIPRAEATVVSSCPRAMVIFCDCVVALSPRPGHTSSVLQSQLDFDII